MKPEWKKLLVLNLPYLLFVYLFAKCGQAYRLAAGVDASAKLLHLTNGISVAFASPLPSLHLFDLCVGVAGAVAVRLIVYSKGKNAKKYRKGEEYGSARWGTAKDIAPYIDLKFENNILLTQTERLTMTGRPKDPKTARNKNVLVIGGSGSGKTRFYVKPNLMQCFPTSDYPTSFVVTDPKGTLVLETGQMFQRAGYRVKILNMINFSKSMKYNPFVYIHSEKDVLKLVNTVREDIVMAMEELELTDAQAQALLESPSPLADVYRYFEKLETGYMDMIRDSIENRADDVCRAKEELRTTPIYPHSAAYAREHGELEQYRASNNVNLQCKESIEAAVREHFDGMYLSHDAAKGVIETYGMERVSMVLSNTIQLQDWDGRYSRRNKEWAKTIPNDNPETVRCGYALNSHPAVLDGFIDLVREEQQRSRTQGEKLQPSRPSVRDKLKQELPPHKPCLLYTSLSGRQEQSAL